MMIWIMGVMFGNIRNVFGSRIFFDYVYICYNFEFIIGFFWILEKVLCNYLFKCKEQQKESKVKIKFSINDSYDKVIIDKDYLGF